jgi:hydroxypyruvate reductase
LIDVLRRVYRRTLERVDLGRRVREALEDRERPRIFAVGKAAPAMLAGAWDKSVREALLVVSDGTPLAYVHPRVEVVYADHPLPTERSIHAAERAFEFARRGPMLALISGGTSSLLCAPLRTLEEKRALTEALLRSGLPIAEMNIVRRHASRIKGGGLARAAGGQVTTLIASDVLKGGVWDIGSGPTVADPTTIGEARAILARVHVETELVETLKPTDDIARLLEHRIVSTPNDLTEAAKDVLEDEGYRVYTLPPSDRDVAELSATYAGLAQTLSPGEALVRVAEPSVRVTAKNPGRGGRSTHLAALLSLRIPRDVAVLCAASDGVDGTSGAAGAIAMSGAMRGLDVRGAIARFETADLHRAAGTLLESRGPTGLNLCDLHVLVRAGK